MKTLNINSVILLIAILLASCTEIIPLKENGSLETRLVVDAAITNEYKAHYVKLTRTQQLSQTGSNRVTGAYVRVYENNVEHLFTEVDTIPGLYYSQPFAGISGNTYTLKIDSVDINRDNVFETYTAVQTMPGILVIDSIGYEYVVKWEATSIKCYAWDPIEANYYNFRGYKNDTLFTDSLPEFGFTDDLVYNGRYTAGIECLYLRDEKTDEHVRKGDILTLEIENITKQHFDYLNTSQRVYWGYNPMFGGLPANALTNIDNDALGIFRVFTVSRASVEVTADLPRKLK
jgi:hypothetical protein